MSPEVCSYTGVPGPLAGDVYNCPACGRWCVLEGGLIREHLAIPITMEEALDDAARRRIQIKRGSEAAMTQWYVVQDGAVIAAVMSMSTPDYFRPHLEVLTEDEMMARYPRALERYEFWEKRP